MIARVWHGIVPTQKSDEYLRRMRTVAIPDYRSVPGNRGAFILHHVEDKFSHFITLTFWESREAISEFAGDNIEAAKYYDFDREFLLELEPLVKHYDLYAESSESQRGVWKG
jgi:heme-degrading monooxygenase HmoA